MRKKRTPEELATLKESFFSNWNQYVDPLFDQEGNLPVDKFEWLKWIAKEVGISYPGEVIKFLAEAGIEVKKHPIYQGSIEKVSHKSNLPKNSGIIYVSGASPRISHQSTNINSDGMPTKFD